jgi:hypothetical protein
MKLAFVATARHTVLPRAVRKALRVVTVKVKAQVHDGVDDYLRTGYKIDTYHTQNLEYLDRGYDFDEFGDIDNELEGLTVFEPLNEVELFQYCTGYNII